MDDVVFYLFGGDSEITIIQLVGKHLAKETPDIGIPFDGDSSVSVLDRIAAAFPQDRISRLDGVRVEFEDGWGLARSSVTEPAITLRFEANDPSRLNEIAEEFLAAVPELARKALPLP